MSCMVLLYIGIAMLRIVSSAPTFLNAFHPRLLIARLMDLPWYMLAVLISALRSNRSTLYPLCAKNTDCNAPTNPPPTMVKFFICCFVYTNIGLIWIFIRAAYIHLIFIYQVFPETGRGQATSSLVRSLYLSMGLKAFVCFYLDSVG